MRVLDYLVEKDDFHFVKANISRPAENWRIGWGDGETPSLGQNIEFVKPSREEIREKVAMHLKISTAFKDVPSEPDAWSKEIFGVLRSLVFERDLHFLRLLKVHADGKRLTQGFSGGQKQYVKVSYHFSKPDERTMREKIHHQVQRMFFQFD
jgi:hypothetical protein